MDPVAVALVLVSAGVHVGWNLLVKSSPSPRAFSAVKGIPFVVLSLAVVACVPLANLPPLFWACVVASGAVHAVYFLALSSAYTEGDLSLVYDEIRLTAHQLSSTGKYDAVMPLAFFDSFEESDIMEVINASLWQEFAPGDQINTTAPGNTYRVWSGTSFAAPVVSGIVALIQQAFGRVFSEVGTQPIPLPSTAKGGTM